MSQENVEIVRFGYEQFRERGAFLPELATDDFVWDMSHFHSWLEQQVYEGTGGAESFLEAWTSAWTDWELQVEELHDAGEKVVAVLRQSGRSKLTDIPAETSFAQVWSFRDGLQARVENYSDVGEALKAAGLRA